MECPHCGQDKPEREFLPYNKPFCKDCVREDGYHWCLKHSERRLRYYEIPGYKERRAQYYKEWYRRNGRKRKSNYANLISTWQNQNPEKVKAAKSLSNALHQGLIIKPLYCSNCGEAARLIGHHTDYNRPLDVIWLCASCHKKLHRNKIPT